MGDGKLQIEKRMDRVESAIRILAQEGDYDQDIVERIEQTLRGETPVVQPQA